MKIKLISAILLICNTLCVPLSAVELREGRSIRDAEIERVLKSYIHPLFRVAKLNPKKLNLIVIYDSNVNAAATLDNTLMINTGLILEADSAAEVIGVLAHETAHIADGHVVRGIGVAEDAMIQTLIGKLLGAVVAIAAKQPGLGAGVDIASQEMAKGIYLKHSRTQEGAADQGALRYLDQLNWTSEGLLHFMTKLMQYDPRSSKDDIYQYTHPLTTERVSAFKYHLSRGMGTGGPIPKKLEDGFKRVKAKIEAFTLPSHILADKYNGDSAIDQYVHAVSAFRSSDFDGALKKIDKLLQAYPKDPDYWDLKGQVLFESGRAEEAVAAYANAVKYDPESALLRALWAQAMLASGNSSYLPKAEQELLRATQEEPYSPLYWHLLAIAYGRQEKIGLAALSLSEQYLLEGSFNEASNQAKRAKHYLGEGAPQVLRADDIINEVKRLIKLSR